MHHAFSNCHSQVTPPLLDAQICLRIHIIENYECALAVESSEQTDSVSWHKLWQETNAMFSRCLRKGEEGYSNGLGELVFLLL